MVWGTNVADILNMWAQFGVFSYVIPFLLIFAVVFAILQKTRILGDNKAIEAVMAGAIALLSLQFDFVSTFFANIFPKFGVGLAVFLVLIILIGFFYHDKDGEPSGAIKWIGWAVGIAVVIWALTQWNFWGDNFGVGLWFEQYFWPLVILGGLIAIIIVIARSGGGSKSSAKTP